MSSFQDFKAAEIPGAREIRVITLSEEEIVQRAREAFLFSHPNIPNFVRRLCRSGKLDWALASARQALRDIEKPVDFLTHEARAAWVLNTHAGLMSGLSKEAREAVAQIAVTAVRVGTKDFAPPPHAVIQHGGLIGWLVALAIGGTCAVMAIL